MQHHLILGDYTTLTVANFNRNSLDAIVSKVFEKLDGVEAKLGALTIQVEKTNGRLRTLEGWRYLLTGGILTIATVIGWYIAYHTGK